MKRRVNFEVSPHLILDLLETGTMKMPDHTVEIKNGVPEDARLVDVSVNSFRNLVFTVATREGWDGIPIIHRLEDHEIQEPSGE